MQLRSTLRHVALAGAIAFAPCALASDKGKTDMIERGRYLVKIAGCNDCHTQDYAPKGGRVPEQQWLTGDTLGWRGPWGTTYPTNLRLYLATMSEDEWLRKARTLSARPPMPWFAVRDMTEQDLRAIYRYVRVLGPAGKPAPAFVPPEREPNGPVIAFPANH
jgi:mono/diheme cytochrome c family protein